MLTELKTLIEKAATTVVGNKTVPLYTVEYEEASMMNIAADEIKSTQPWAYIEEFVQGIYSKEKYAKQKSTQVQVYFCRFTEMQNTAEQREAIRAQIESEMVLPFMDVYNDAGIFDRVDNWRFYTPLPRFDANEISIMLQFDCKKNIC